jgi:hypothetical protein
MTTEQQPRVEPTGCPHLDGYNPLTPEELADPYPSFARATRGAGVLRTRVQPVVGQPL